MENDKYPGLKKVSDALRVLAWAVVVICAVSFLVSLGLIVRNPKIGGGLLAASLIYGIFGFLYLYTMSQLILVALDIEANTRKTEKETGQVSQ